MICLLIAAASGSPLTADDAVRQALAHNPALARSQSSVDAAEGRLLSARGVFDPYVGAWTNYTPLSKDVQLLGATPYLVNVNDVAAGISIGGLTASGGEYSLSGELGRTYGRYNILGGDVSLQQGFSGGSAHLSQPLLRGYKTSYNLRDVVAATDRVTLADLRVTRDRQALIAATTRAYWSWAYATDVVGIATDAQTAAEESLRVGRLREKAGTIAPIELTRLESSAVQSETDRLRATADALAARHALALAMGGDLPTDAAPADATATPALVGGADPVATALSGNPDLAIARALRDTADRVVGNADHARLPTLAATVDAGVRGVDVQGLDTRALPYTTLGATLDVPLGNRTARGELDAATADRHAAELTIAELEAQVRAEVEQALAELASATQRVDLADANVRLTKALLDAEEASVASGGAIQQDLLQARVAYARARTEAARARADRAVWATELARLEGTLAAP